MTTLRVEDFDTSVPETVSLFLGVSAAPQSAKWISDPKEAAAENSCKVWDNSVHSAEHSGPLFVKSTNRSSLFILNLRDNIYQNVLIAREWTCCLQMDMLLKNGATGWKWTCCLKMDLLLKNGPTGWNWTCCLKMDLLLEIGPTGWKWTCCLKMDLLAENGPADWKWTHCLKRDPLNENRSTAWKWSHCLKMNHSPNIDPLPKNGGGGGGGTKVLHIPPVEPKAPFFHFLLINNPIHSH